jgi:hypothetical protein
MTEQEWIRLRQLIDELADFAQYAHDRCVPLLCSDDVNARFRAMRPLAMALLRIRVLSGRIEDTLVSNDASYLEQLDIARERMGREIVLRDPL